MVPGMPKIVSDKVEVYVFRPRGDTAELLLLKRTPHRETLPGIWQPVTGGIERGESAATAARREVLEETGLVPKRMWALECPTTFFDATTDTLTLLPLFAAEVGARARVVLSDEHDAFAFVSPATAARRCLWDAQRRAIDALAREILRGGARARALELEAPVVPRTRARAKPPSQHRNR